MEKLNIRNKNEIANKLSLEMLKLIQEQEEKINFLTKNVKDINSSNGNKQSSGLKKVNTILTLFVLNSVTSNADNKYVMNQLGIDNINKPTNIKILTDQNSKISLK